MTCQQRMVPDPGIGYRSIHELGWTESRNKRTVPEMNPAHYFLILSPFLSSPLLPVLFSIYACYFGHPSTNLLAGMTSIKSPFGHKTKGHVIKNLRVFNFTTRKP